MLAETLVSLHAHLLKLNALLQVQLVLIDNNSPDRTPDVMAEWQMRFPVCVHRRETQQGLSYARNAGLDAATGDVVVFLDDDVELHDDWLPTLLHPFTDTKVAAVGGKVLAFGSNELPDWLPREYGYLVSVFDPFDSPRETDKVMGANFALRSSIVRQVGTFDPALGRKGNKLLGGEEVDLFNRIRRVGGIVWYTPHSVVFHKIANKLRKEYIVDYAYWLGVSEAHLEKRLGQRLKYAFKLLRSWCDPWLINPVRRPLASTPAAQMRSVIRERYAAGYRNMHAEID
ncbi:glycosyltransferase involved in cell wall biosynthesis [Kinneretia asaccharophila]|uniref:Glycosyltransferase involved in cell wall biosynthesis n=2 Tax=Roseateles asaccharophilus TaxID=582607 RepID=A0ABU2AFY0_9BURK|nr:glycosyltransferase involved in cell wall biosynthesis [Roseateles asaccharophilus]